MRLVDDVGSDNAGAISRLLMRDLRCMAVDFGENRAKKQKAAPLAGIRRWLKVKILINRPCSFRNALDRSATEYTKLPSLTVLYYTTLVAFLGLLGRNIYNICYI